MILGRIETPYHAMLIQYAVKTAAIIIISYMAIPLIDLDTKYSTSLSLLASIQKGEFGKPAPTLIRIYPKKQAESLTMQVFPHLPG